MMSTTTFRRLLLVSTLALVAIAATPSSAHANDISRYVALAEQDTAAFVADDDEDENVFDERDLDLLEERDDDDDEDCEDDDDVAKKVNVKTAQKSDHKKHHKSSSSSSAAAPASTPASNVQSPAYNPASFSAEEDNAPAAVVSANGAITFAPSFAVVGATVFAGALLL